MAKGTNDKEYMCNLCCEVLPLKDFIKLCNVENDNMCCCNSCASNIFQFTKEGLDGISSTSDGHIPRKIVVCPKHERLIDPSIKCVPNEVSKLFDKKQLFECIDPESRMLIKITGAQVLYKGLTLKFCSNLNECKSVGFFHPSKGVCRVDDEKNVDKMLQESEFFCYECIIFRKSKLKNQWEEIGFNCDSGIPSRACPQCKKMVFRDVNTCPRLQCVCGVNWCFCCGCKFRRRSTAYYHLDSAYGKRYPSDEEIIEYNKQYKKMKQQCLSESLKIFHYRCYFDASRQTERQYEKLQLNKLKQEEEQKRLIQIFERTKREEEERREREIIKRREEELRQQKINKAKEILKKRLQIMWQKKEAKKIEEKRKQEIKKEEIRQQNVQHYEKINKLLLEQEQEKNNLKRQWIDENNNDWNDPNMQFDEDWDHQLVSWHIKN